MDGRVGSGLRNSLLLFRILAQAGPPVLESREIMKVIHFVRYCVLIAFILWHLLPPPTRTSKILLATYYICAPYVCVFYSIYTLHFM